MIEYFKFISRTSFSKFYFVPGEIIMLKIETKMKKYASATWIGELTYTIINCEERSRLWTANNMIVW